MKLTPKLFLTTTLLALILLPLGAVAKAQQIQFTTPIAVVNASFLNVRTGPAVKYEVLLTTVGGTELPVIGIASDRVWYQVSTIIGTGWINSEFTIPRGDFTNTPVVDLSTFIPIQPTFSLPNTIGLPNGQGGGIVINSIPATTSATVNTGGAIVAGKDPEGNNILVTGNERYRATLTAQAVNLRAAPGEDQLTVATLYQNPAIDYPIVGNARDANSIEWLSIITPQGTGWVDAPKLALRLSGAFQTVMVVTGDSVALGDGPGTGSNTLPILTNGTEGFLRNISQDSNFIQIELGGGEIGWIPFSAASQRTGTPTDGLNLDPAIAPVSIIPGQATTTFTQPPSFGLSTPRVIINTGFLNIRSGPGAQYTTVVTVSGGTELPVIGMAKDRVWYLVQGAFGRGWINSEFTIFRGVIDNVPIINTDIVVNSQLDQAVAVISAPTTLYAAPGTNFGAIGSIAGPSELTIVARTVDSTWVQVKTDIGFGWILASQVIIRGDTSRVPVVS